MSRPPKIPESVRDLAVEVAKIRRSLPTDKELARRAGVSVRAIRYVMKRAFLSKTEVSRETDIVIMRG